jgi:hypothetical protein
MKLAAAKLAAASFNSELNPGRSPQILPPMEPRFSELNKVRVICDRLGNDEGYVIASQFKDGRWIYKISISEDPKSSKTFDNWIPEECLQLTR